MPTLFIVDLRDSETGEVRGYVFDAPCNLEMKAGFESGTFSKNDWREYAWARAVGVPIDVALRISKRADNSAPRRYTARIEHGGELLYEDIPSGA